MSDDPVEKFSVDDFKHWMKSNGDYITRMSRPILGSWVESKVPPKKLVAKVSLEEGNLKEVILDFKRSGGKVIAIDENSLLIEVSCGAFYVPKQYVRKR